MSSPYLLLGRTLLPLLRRRIERVEGLEQLPPGGGFIVAANHQSWIDSPLIAAAIHTHLEKSLRFIAQSSKYRFLGAIPINEYDKSRVLDIALGYLKAGHPVVIFPEGNSNPEPQLRPGRTGVARLALRSGLPVVPVGIKGTGGIGGWSSLLWLISFWKKAVISVGQPMHYEPLDQSVFDGDMLTDVTKQIMQRISSLCGKFVSEQPIADVRAQHHLPSQGKMFHDLVMPLLTYRVEVVGANHLPATGPYIVAANHLSYFDAPALSLAVYRERRVRPMFLTKPSIATLWRRFVGEGGLQVMGMLPIDAQSRSTVLDHAAKYLEQGGVIGIFPEGTRNKPSLNTNWPGTMLKAKTGTARLYLKHPIPIVPAGISAPEGLGLGATIRNFLLPWKKVRIVFGEPLMFEGMENAEPTREELDSMSREIMTRIAILSGQTYPY